MNGGGINPLPQHVALIKGIVEVKKTMRGTSKEERIRIAHICKDALMESLLPSSNGIRTNDITGNITNFNIYGTVIVNGPYVQVFHENQMISNQMAQDISTIVALRGSNGLLVVIGKCQIRRERVAVVLDLSSDQRADLVIDDYQKLKNNVTELSAGSSFQNGGAPQVPVKKPMTIAPSPPSATPEFPNSTITHNKPVNEPGVSALNSPALHVRSSQPSEISTDTLNTTVTSSPVAPPGKLPALFTVPKPYVKPYPVHTPKPYMKATPIIAPKPYVHDSSPTTTLARGSNSTKGFMPLVGLVNIYPQQQPPSTPLETGVPYRSPHAAPSSDILEERQPHDPLPRIPLSINRVSDIYITPNEPVVQKFVIDKIPTRGTYIEPLPDCAFTNIQQPVPYTGNLGQQPEIPPKIPLLPPTHPPPQFTSASTRAAAPYNGSLSQSPTNCAKSSVPPYRAPEPPPRPVKSADIRSKFSQLQINASGVDIRQSTEPEEEALGSYNLQTQTFSENKDEAANDMSPLNDTCNSPSSSAVYGDFHQPVFTNVQQQGSGPIKLNKVPFAADINRTWKKMKNISLQSQKKQQGEDMDKALQGGYDFQTQYPPDDDDDDGIPVLRHYRPLPPGSPAPQCSPVNRISASSDSGQSDSTEEPEYVSQETYYQCLGISVEDSERIYMNRPIRQNKRHSKTPHTLAEDIICFVIEDSKYIGTLDSISKARNEMPPKLQSLLRKTQSLSLIHTNMYHDLKNCTDSCSKISQVLINYRDQLETHIYYLIKAPEINNLMNELPKSFLKTYPEIKDKIRSSWKKFTFYILSLEKFLKSAPEEDKAAIMEALEIIRELNKRADTEVLLDGIKGAPYPLHTLGILLLHSSFAVSGPLLKKDFTIRVLLFPKTIVITHHKNNKYEYLLDIPVTQSYFAVTNALKQDQSKTFSLEVNFGGVQGKKQYIFQAPTQEVKEAWVSAITRIMNDFALEEKKEQEKRNAS